MTSSATLSAGIPSNISTYKFSREFLGCGELIEVVWSRFPSGMEAIFGGSRIRYCFKKESKGSVSEM